MGLRIQRVREFYKVEDCYELSQIIKNCAGTVCFELYGVQSSMKFRILRD